MKKLIFFLFVFCWTASQARPLKVACIGNSVTYGAGIENREADSYPAQLQRMLGDGYEVRNFGHSGTTLLSRGHRPYIDQQEYRDALAFAADRVVIHLGLNDTDPRDWPNYRDDFVSDYLALIASFRTANPACEIWICRMTPVAHRHPRFLSGTRDWYEMIQKKIEEIAVLSHTGLIDLQKALYNRSDLLPDALHPTAEGANILARTVYSALTGDYGGLRCSPLYSDHMVLQRGQPLPLSGTANAGEKVTVAIAGQRKETITGPDGRWQVTLEPLATRREPETLRIFTPSCELVFEDVWIGEVWLCSGQSNMAFRLNESVPEEQATQLAYAGNHPPIRLFDAKPRWETNAVEWEVSTLDSLNRLAYYRETGWEECNAETAARFSAIGFAFGRMLAERLQVPVGLICNAVGGSPTEAWIDRKTLESDFPAILSDWTKNDFIQDWVRERARLNIRQATDPLQRHPYEPCYLFEAGILPLEKYPVKGIVWYQGESNAHQIETHEKLFPMLVNSWRSYWGSELPFYYVQLSSLNRPSWTWFRDSQRRLMNRIPHCGMAVSSDRGDSLDVHPRQKKEVGERLAYWALNRTYGYPTVPSGPLFRSAEFTADTVFVSFDYAEGLQTSDHRPLRTFEIAETDGLFVPAQAVVTSDGRIKLWNEQIRRPRLIRYGWQPFTRANLVNEQGLPASTFRAVKEPVVGARWENTNR